MARVANTAVEVVKLPPPLGRRELSGDWTYRTNAWEAARYSRTKSSYSRRIASSLWSWGSIRWMQEMLRLCLSTHMITRQARWIRPYFFFRGGGITCIRT